MQAGFPPVHGCLHEVQTDSLQLQCPQEHLRVDFTAAVSIRLPHERWVLEDGSKALWQSLAVEGSQNVPLDIKLLWDHGALPEPWNSLTESLGQALSKAALWDQLGLATSLAIPSHDRISITLHSTYHTALPPDLLLPTSTIQAIRWTLDFTPFSQAQAPVSHPSLQHVQPLVDDCITSFLNNRRGAPAITGGLLTPGVPQQLRSAMTSIEAITSTLTRYATQCDDYGQFRLKIQNLKKKVASISLAKDEVIDLQGIIKGQVYHQIMRALQSTRPRRKIKFASSSSENELLSKPLEKFQDLFEGSRSLLSQEDVSDEGAVDDEAEQSEFEDLFGVCDDDYSDFEDLLEEVHAISKPNKEANDMTPDSPASAAVAAGTAPPHDAPDTQHSLRPDYDMLTESSETGYTILDDSLATCADVCDNDFCDIASPQSSPMPCSILIERDPKSATGNRANVNGEGDEESLLMML